MRRLPRVAVIGIACVLAACATTPRGDLAPSADDRAAVRASLDDAWALSPRDLPAPLSLQQQLVIERGAQSQAFDALLQTDSERLQLVVQAMGQTALRLSWDGQRIEEQRADWLPPQVNGARVLQDLQFALWPLDALRRAAPIGWHVVEQGDVREIFVGDRLIVGIYGRSDEGFSLERPAVGYRLRVRSIDLGGAAP